MKAEVVYLFAFDVASEIATSRIQSVLSVQPLPFDIRTDHTFPRDVPLHRPLSVEPKLTATLNGRPVRALVRIYEVGAITIALRVGLEVGGLPDLIPFHNPQLGDDLILDALARRLCTQVRESLHDLMIH